MRSDYELALAALKFPADARVLVVYREAELYHVEVLERTFPRIQFTVLVPSSREYTQLQRVLEERRHRHTIVVLDCDDGLSVEASFEAALINTDGPSLRGNSYTVRLLERLIAALSPGGQLWLEGSTRRGVLTFAGHLKEQGLRTTLVDRAGGRRLFTVVRPATLPFALERAPSRVIEAVVRGVHLTLQLEEGVFASRGIDQGTELLLEHLRVHAGERVLDVGCGTGVVGIVIKLLEPRTRVMMVDASPQAVQLAEENAARNRVEIAAILLSDVYAAIGHERFDLIVANPPFHTARGVTRAVARDIVIGSPQHLHPQGRLVLVANAFLPYQRLLEATFHTVEQLVRSNRYTVWQASDPR